MTTEQSIKAYVSLGSNSPDAEALLARARRCLTEFPHLRLGAASPVYSTEPQEFTEQPWFLNQVVELLPEASWRPLSLLEALLEMEAGLGRVRSPDPALRYGPRAIDADLLLYGEEESADPRCLLPHPRLAQRAFALVPLLDIAPDILIRGIPASLCLNRLRYRLEGRRIFQ